MKTTISPSRYQAEKNKVLDDTYRVSSNFDRSDKIFRNYLKTHVSASGMKYMHAKLEEVGEEAAGKMNELSLLADKFTPELIKRNSLGEDINEIRFHPGYRELMKIAVKSEMFRVKWNPELKNKFDDEKT